MKKIIFLTIISVLFVGLISINSFAEEKSDAEEEDRIAG